MEQFAGFRLFVIDHIFDQLFKFIHESLQSNGSVEYLHHQEKTACFTVDFLEYYGFFTDLGGSCITAQAEPVEHTAVELV